jgi:MFS family permease
MVASVFKRIKKSGHPWRKINFSELSELYISSLLRTLAHSMVGIFIPVYLVANGFSVAAVIFYFAMFYGFGLIGVNEVTGRLIARFGPKHIIGASFFLQIFFFVLLASLPSHHWPLWILALTARIASCAYYMPRHVSFSKIKHKDRGGKELGLLDIFERGAGVIGPIIGGVVATIFDGQAILIVASILFACAVLPLLMSVEHIKTHQRYSYKKMPLRKMRRALIVNGFSNLENGLTIWLWPLYVGIFIFTTEPYLKLGIVSSIGTVVAILAAMVVGRIIDNKKGHDLLKYSVIANAIVHGLRLLATGLKSVILVNIINEPTTTAPKMWSLVGHSF